jgi:serine/threonine-protein kinase
VVHRDVSPHNILVGSDGVPRVLDFGIAKAIGRARTTRDGAIRGKLAYMAPEQLAGHVTRRTDVYAASAVLWELLTGRRLFPGNTAMMREERSDAPRARTVVPGIPEELDAIVARGLELDPDRRFPTARAMAVAIETAVPVIAASAVGAWVEDLAGPVLEARLQHLVEVEAHSLQTTSAEVAPLGKAEPGALRTETLENARPEAPDQRGTRRLRSKTSVLRMGAMTGAILTAALVGVMAARTRHDHEGGHAPSAQPSDHAEAKSDPFNAASPTITLGDSRDADNVAPSVVPDTPAARSSVSARGVTSAQRHPPVLTKHSRCEPPFYVDPNGRKVPKAECF